MISLLSGKPIIHGNECVVMCNGVGYGVAVNEHTLHLLSSQEEATLFIHTHVREDEIKLYGFSTLQERHLFELLSSSVQGVGPKTALVILNSPIGEISQAVEEGDVTFFTQFPRVGKKLAQKIILELRSKLGDAKDLSLSFPTGKAKDVQEALHALGYTDREIVKVLRTINIEQLSVQDAIKESLKTIHTS